ncbi:DNA polymerase V subunit UmuD [Alcanivorax hongdengensis A-11-3]|uniref:DNA polymerase V subunit UmuD n=1 Tax=Alcanivorax hongdengensis A-11-3 TaxID=1177179 RepID=L0WEA3_9GAMM|nr:DNA polymerase V subunit UmuD [Alcanivorax hongdengensis A-11-3]
MCLPLFSQPVAAGFPSPAQDHVEQRLDLNGLCIKHPQATYFVRAKGDSMVEHGIVSGDILVVDRALEARHGDIIIASLQGDFTVKRLCLHPSPCLQPGNPAYPPIAIEEDNPPDIFGVVTFVVHPTRLS